MPLVQRLASVGLGPKAEEGRLVGAEAAPCFAMAFYKGTH